MESILPAGSAVLYRRTGRHRGNVEFVELRRASRVLGVGTGRGQFREDDWERRALEAVWLIVGRRFAPTRWLHPQQQSRVSAFEFGRHIRMIRSYRVQLLKGESHVEKIDDRSRDSRRCWLLFRRRRLGRSV